MSIQIVLSRQIGPLLLNLLLRKKEGRRKFLETKTTSRTGWKFTARTGIRGTRSSPAGVTVVCAAPALYSLYSASVADMEDSDRTGNFKEVTLILKCNRAGVLAIYRKSCICLHTLLYLPTKFLLKTNKRMAIVVLCVQCAELRTCPEHVQNMSVHVPFTQSPHCTDAAHVALIDTGSA